jgi:hypothetical protein
LVKSVEVASGPAGFDDDVPRVGQQLERPAELLDVDAEGVQFGAAAGACVQ